MINPFLFAPNASNSGRTKNSAPVARSQWIILRAIYGLGAQDVVYGLTNLAIMNSKFLLNSFLQNLKSLMYAEVVDRKRRRSRF